MGKKCIKCKMCNEKLSVIRGKPLPKIFDVNGILLCSVCYLNFVYSNMDIKKFLGDV